ncbi:MAG: extracellular solute-binding protein [Armatimonadetes bacterium]|nr:extracellular solute-binding protein [Armatimonadota bacterium]
MRGAFLISVLVLCIASVAMWKSQPNEAADGRTRLVWTSDDNPLRKEQVELFNQTNRDCQLVLDPVNSQIEKVIVQSIAGVGPDLLDCRDTNQLQAFVKAGIAWDVTEELPKLGIDIKKDTWPVMQPMGVFENRVYGVPTNCAPNAVWVNEELVARCGVTIPRTPLKWNDLIRLAQKLTIRDSNGQPIQYGFLFDWWNFSHFLLTYGAQFFNEDGTKCIVDSPEAIEAVQLMHDLIYKYKVAPSPVEEAGLASQGGWGSGTINYFGAKRGALALGGRWWLANLRKFTGLKLGVIQSPFGTVQTSSAAGRVTLINKNSPHRQEALKFLAFLASKPYNTLINSQADGIAAFKEYCVGADFQFDPKHPDELDNDVWKDAADRSSYQRTSPFINGGLANQILSTQLDLVRIDAKSAQAALHDAATEINFEIKQSIRKKPKLREEYDRRIREAGR